MNRNEVLKRGHSSTQEPVTYPFYLKDRVIRLIDTPGIGDSRGMEHDKQNMENILSHLTRYDEIHAICILLKPNTSKLTVLFRFCIEELLYQLHRDALANIVFCFTNTRNTSYCPGDTFDTLSEELEKLNVDIQLDKTNMFCFDNEAFRYLACIEHNIEFTEKDHQNYSESWEKSANETNRLVEHIQIRKPHQIRNTLSLNEARRIIIGLSRPMGEVTKCIQENIVNLKTTKARIDSMDKDIEEFKGKLNFEGVTVQRKELGFPRTVCTHHDCVEYILLEDQTHQVDYVKHCHEHCFLNGVSSEIVGEPQLQGCLAMTKDKSSIICRFCGHSYEVHMHRTYDLERVTKSFVSPEVSNNINKMESEKEKLHAYTKQLEEIIGELKHEDSKVVSIFAKFGNFLKKISIVPCNDSTKDYLDMIIDQEERQPDEIRNNDLIARLNKTKEAYLQEVRIIQNAMDSSLSGTISSPDEVKQLQLELFELKHFGTTLKDIFNETEESKQTQRTFWEIEVKVLSKPYEFIKQKAKKIKNVAKVVSYILDHL